jgi:DNA-binding PadR family transcriptional regulator
MVDRDASAVTAGTLRSPVRWALLGLVIQRPSYGYELVQRFERTYDETLSLSSHSQIYTALDTLARKQLIEEVPAEEVSAEVVRQPKPHYRATAKGVNGYQDWLVVQVDEEQRRSRLFACQLAMLAPQDALAVIERYEQTCLREAGRTFVPAEEHSSGKLDASAGTDGLVSRLLTERDRLTVSARLAWIEYVRCELRALSRGRASPRP